MIDWNLYWLVIGRFAACAVIGGSIVFWLSQNTEATEEGLKRIREQWDRMYMETFAPMGSRPKEHEEGGDDETE